MTGEHKNIGKISYLPFAQHTPLYISHLTQIYLPFCCHLLAIILPYHLSLTPLCRFSYTTREAGAIASRGAYQKTLSLVRKAKSPS